MKENENKQKTKNLPLQMEVSAKCGKSYCKMSIKTPEDLSLFIEILEVMRKKITKIQ